MAIQGTQEEHARHQGMLGLCRLTSPMPKAFRVAGLLQLHLVQVEVELMATATTTGPGMSPPFLSSADNL